MTGFFVACALVASLQFLRVKDRRMLAIVALFLLRAAALALGQSSAAGLVADVLSGAMGLALVYWLSPHAPHGSSH